MKTINVIVYENRHQVHGSIGKINNYSISSENYDLGDPVGYGEFQEDAIEDFIESYNLKFDEDIEVNIIAKQTV